MHYKYYTIIFLLSINISYAKTIFNFNDTTKTYEWIVSETDIKELNQLSSSVRPARPQKLTIALHCFVLHEFCCVSIVSVRSNASF